MGKALESSDYDFYFTRLSYESGDWEVDERMPANVLNSLIEYTSLRVDLQERIVPLSDPAMLTAPGMRWTMIIPTLGATATM